MKDGKVPNFSKWPSELKDKVHKMAKLLGTDLMGAIDAMISQESMSCCLDIKRRSQ
jgi:hypothetical protein